MLLTVAYLLIAFGLALLVAEVFIPSSGILFVCSCLCIAAGVIMSFVYGDTSTGMLTLLGVCLVMPAVGALMLYIWPRTPMGKRLVLRDQDSTIASMPEHVELENLRGRFGRALSDLRPAGVVDFAGRRIDSITEGMMVTAGSWVRCVEVKAGKVLVRPVDKPDLGALESADLG